MPVDAPSNVIALGTELKCSFMSEIGERMSLGNRLLVCSMAVALTSAFALRSNASAQTASFGGRVTDAQGGVVPNAQVSLAPVVKVMPGMTMAPPAPLPGRMNPDGTFVFNQIPPGDYILQVDAPGFERSSQGVTLPTTQTFNVKLEVLEIPGAETATPT